MVISFLLFTAANVFALCHLPVPCAVLTFDNDRQVVFGPALVTSVRTVTEQPVPMLTWAAIVAGLTVIGMLTFFAAFAVIFPWLGYATWHGYRSALNVAEWDTLPSVAVASAEGG